MSSASHIFGSLRDYLLGFFSFFFSSGATREGNYVVKELNRYINYKKDILRPETLEEIQARLIDLKDALSQKDPDIIREKSNLARQFFDTLPLSNRGSLAENTEAFFVIIAIFVGFNAYIAQPFRIPTGSMQPSLNGIQAIPLKDTEEKPGFFKQIGNAFQYGSSYRNIVADSNKSIVAYKNTSFLLFSRCVVKFNDNSEISLPGTDGEISRYFTTTKGVPYPSFKEGETIVNANFTAGDIVVVNKMAYHFRAPKRGEVFVFNTKGIQGVQARSRHDQAGPHYIKRLVGVPGDSLQIKSPYLMVNGEPAKEATIRRVIDGKPPYNPGGYQLATNDLAHLKQFLTKESDILQLKKYPHNPYLNEYAAMGDNTGNSLDSRYWGPLRQYNILGPGLFVLWPFTNHWGLIP